MAQPSLAARSPGGLEVRVAVRSDAFRTAQSVKAVDLAQPRCIDLRGPFPMQTQGMMGDGSPFTDTRLRSSSTCSRVTLADRRAILRCTASKVRRSIMAGNAPVTFSSAAAGSRRVTPRSVRRILIR